MSLVEFLEQAWDVERYGHSWFYYICGLNPPSQIEQIWEEQEDFRGLRERERFVALYAANNIAFHLHALVCVVF